MIRSLRGAFAFSFLLGTFAAAAAEPWEGAPFTGDPKAILAAAEQVRPQNADDGVIVLLEEATVTFDASAKSTRVQRLLYRVIDESAVDGWSHISAEWSPWYHEKPVVDARVIAKDGTVHPLDKKSFGTEDAEDDPDMFSDTRVLSGPLPAIAPGSVVEQTITYREKNPLDLAGVTDRHTFSRWVETRQGRLTIEWPSAVNLRYVNRTRPAVEPRKTESDGVTRLVFETGPMKAVESYEWNLPSDTNIYSYVAWSTGASWQSVAKRYAEIVDGKIGDLGVVDRITKAAVGNAKEPREIAARLLAAVERDIRYAGVEFGEGSIVPRTPAETLKNKYGDCKDKATLLVAMLRRAGIPAHVALLRSGQGYDVEPELPGLGYFDHVIVVTEGADPIWIDPTDEFARAGELPDSDQGRLALIAHANTTALTRTPMATSEANRLVETREFKLAEEGKAAITETSEYSGSDERSMRRYYTANDQKQLREGLQNYVETAYLAKELAKWEMSPTHDLATPFRLRVETNAGGRGTTGDGEAAVAIFLGRLVGDLPEPLRTEREDDDKPRVNDYVFSKPYVLELRYRIVPPPGYTVRTLPENETVKVGTATMTKAYTRRDDGVVLADYRFDSGPRRITAAQYEEMRRDATKIMAEKALLIYFDQDGRTYLNAGEVGKAVAEFRRLAALHPKEALHHRDVAHALLAGGMGAAARREAQRAVEIEPQSANAHAMVAQTLLSDLIGRRFRSGFELEKGIAAYRKAKELAPEDTTIRAELAHALQYNAQGIRYAKDAKLDEAIAEYVAFKEIKDADVPAIDGELMTLYAFTGRWDELKQLLATTTNAERKNAYLLVAAGASGGPEAALKAAATIEREKRRETLTAAGGMLALLRQYPAAAALLTEAAQGAPNAAELRVQAELLRKTVRIETMPHDPADPKSVLKQAMDEYLRTGSEEVTEKYATADATKVFAGKGVREAANDAKNSTRTVKQMLRDPRTAALVVDMAISALEMQQDGGETVGYRLRGRAPGAEQSLTLYVVKENGEHRVAGSASATPELALRALRHAEKNELAAAKQWLDWAREHVTGGYKDDPLLSEPFADVWTRGREATLDEVRLAAAILLPETKGSAELALPILTGARAAATPEVQTRIDQALLVAYGLTGNWTELLATADRLAVKFPDSAHAFTQAELALTKLGRMDDVRTRATARLQRTDDDPAALNALARHALDRFDYAEALTHYAKLLQHSEPRAVDYNQHAWTSLFTPDADLEKAADSAQKAVAIVPEQYASLNTLAVVYAEQGKSSEARDTLLKSLEEHENDEIRDPDWYVVGRIAENYGIRDAALEAYTRIRKPEEKSSSSTWELAQKRLAKLK